MDAVSNAIDQVVSLPPEVLIGAAVVMVVGFVLLRR